MSTATPWSPSGSSNLCAIKLRDAGLRWTRPSDEILGGLRRWQIFGENVWQPKRTNPSIWADVCCTCAIDPPSISHIQLQPSTSRILPWTWDTNWQPPRYHPWCQPLPSQQGTRCPMRGRPSAGWVSRPAPQAMTSWLLMLFRCSDKYHDDDDDDDDCKMVVICI